MSNTPLKNVDFIHFILSGLLCGFLAAIANIIYMFIYQNLTGYSVPEVINIGTVVSSSVIGLVIGSITFFFLSRISRNPTSIFFWIAIIFTFLSMVGPFFPPALSNGSPIPSGFAGLTGPMHIIAGSIAAFFIPKRVVSVSK